jgi:hypothetical protein
MDNRGAYSDLSILYQCALFCVIFRVASFFLLQHTKTGKIYTKLPQKATKYTKWLYNRPNGNKIYKHLPKFTQICIFCFKIYHLATVIILINCILAPVRHSTYVCIPTWEKVWMHTKFYWYYIVLICMYQWNGNTCLYFL